MTRRLTTSLLTLLLMASPALSATESVLRVLAWPGYADDDLVASFEAQNKVDVQVTYISSDDALWQKINTNLSADFDVFAVNTAELQRYVAAGLVSPVDRKLVPRVRDQLPRFQDLQAIPGLMHEDKVYGIPYTYAEMGLIWNRKLMPQAPDSIRAMWEPALRGKVLAFDTSSHNFTLAGMRNGAPNPFNLDPAAMQEAANALIELRRNVLTFYSTPEEAAELFAENDIAIVFANYGSQQVQALRKNGADIGYIIPREGALAWLDCWVITRKTRDPGLAHAWIDFTLSPAVSEALVSRQGLSNTLTPGTSFTDSDLIRWLQPVEDASQRNHLWEQIRSGAMVNPQTPP